MDTNSGKLYFAYGSNLSKEQMKRRCPGSVPQGRAILKDYRFLFPRKDDGRWNGGGVAGILPAKGEIVEGALYTMTDLDIQALDGFENVADNHYFRTEIQVTTDQGPTNCFTYIANTEEGYPFTPSDKYLNTILTGARDHDLSQEYLAFLEQFRA